MLEGIFTPTRVINGTENSVVHLQAELKQAFTYKLAQAWLHCAKIIFVQKDAAHGVVDSVSVLLRM